MIKNNTSRLDSPPLQNTETFYLNLIARASFNLTAC